jgi:twitching motility two-component system response regulator PilH
VARKVLLADDSVTAQNMGRRILVDAGYEVITVNNGSSALKKINESRPDLIVLDVYMPGYGGLEVCQRIREARETARIPVLLTVGKLEPFKAEEVRRVRADAFIVKPFEASELLTALTKLEDRIVPQPSQRRRAGKTSPGDDGGREFGDVETGWKNRLSIPPPHHPKGHEAEPESRPVPEDAKPPVETSARPPEPAESADTKDESTSFEHEVPSAPEPAPSSAAPPVHEDRKLGEEEVDAALASLAPANGNGSGHDDAAHAQSALATIASAGSEQFSGPRWIAEEVALADNEALMILEEEMHKAIAAFAAADAACSIPIESTPEPGAASSASRETDPSPTTEPTTLAISEIATEPSSSAVEGENADTPAKEVEAYAAVAAAGAVSSIHQTLASSLSADEIPAEPPTSSDLAAAWASSKHVLDSVTNPDFTSEIAEAAAASLSEQPPAEPATESVAASPTSVPEDGGAIASIVDSVLAELKPKLMEEIAKKMKKDK